MTSTNKRPWWKKIIPSLIVIWAVTLVTFLLSSLLPGDPVIALLGENATAESIAIWRDRFGLDQPIYYRYLQWLGRIFTGDFGFSYHTEEQVLDMILHRLPVTLEILLVTQILALGLAVPLAIASAWRNNKLFDKIAMMGSLSFLSMPPFLVGIILIYFFSIRLGWFPATGFTPLSESITLNLASVLLPSFALALAEFPIYMRLLRADLVHTLQQDFITVARAKGISTKRILWRHALKPSSFSLLTVVGVNIGRLLGGTIIIEVLFAIPGIGQLLIQSIFQQDYLVLQGIVLLVAIGFVLVNIMIDWLYVRLDPRVQ